MPQNYPIVRLKREPQKSARIKSKSRPRFPSKLPPEIQAERLSAGFDRISQSITSIERGINVSLDAQAVVPDRALVFELIGAVGDFQLIAEQLGLQWLSSDEISQTTDGDEDDSEIEADTAPAGAILYITMPSIRGLKNLLALWNRFKKGHAAPDEYRPLWGVFGYLKDLRVWSAKDRIDPSVRKYVLDKLSKYPNKRVLLEIDLWYRSQVEERAQALNTLNEMLKEVDGKLMDKVHIPEIRYQGVLVEVPGSVAKTLIEGAGSLASLNEIMMIRPQSFYLSHIDFEAPTMGEIAESPALDDEDCIAVLFDGYPVADHYALAERLYVHEVDIAAVHVPIAQRHHGTAMASLVLHGDLHAPGKQFNHKLAVIPVLTSVPGSFLETTPPDKLPIGLIYRAILAVLDKKHDKLKNVVVVNHSLCDINSPFVRRPSPWAALLDHFSHFHRLLFVLSAGNIFDSFIVEGYEDFNALLAADPVERQAVMLTAIEKAKAKRGLLSPAESVNSLTIGAVHGDSAPVPLLASTIDPYPTLPMTNLASAVGFGVNRSVKPDLIEHGGRFALGCANLAGGGVEVFAKGSADLGHLVAMPSAIGDLQQVRRISGTSNAAALITRSCLAIADSVKASFALDGESWLDRPTRAPILKALAAHSAGWGGMGTVLEESYPPPEPKKHVARRDTISKFLGYGRPAADRVLSGDHNRITLLADDIIIPDQLIEYRIPLPAAMLNTKELRSITLTLAWTTPIVNNSAEYRGVALKIVNSTGQRNFWEGVERKDNFQPNAATSERGTLTHFVLTGKTLRKAAFNGGIFIGVQSSARHISLKTAAVPFALAVTLEMAQTQRSTLYAEVSEIIRARASRPTVRVGGRRV